ncbi:MAG: MurR/RpiR family transcriptional regulator [bacterium]|nr:MAG: MurR/RpiR family transcriptional regulator [bacterium]
MLRIDQVVKGRPPELTPTQRKVLDFILKRPEQAVFLTATDLAHHLNVSDTSIVRLAQALGYAGYPHLKRHLRQYVQPKITTVDRLDETVQRVESVRDVLTDVLSNDLKNLKTTLEETDPETFTSFVRELDAARRVFIIALRSTHCLGVFMNSALRFLGRDVVSIMPGTGEMWDQLRDLSPQDVLVGFAFPRYTKVTVEVMEYARERKARVLALTDGDLSPLRRTAHLTLTVPYEINSYIESFTSALSLVNAIVTAVAFENRADTMRVLNEMEDVWKREGVYWGKG